MKILGIHDGHTATACLLQDGHIRAMVSEERFTRIKNDGGVPRQAIEWVLTSTQTDPADIDIVAVAGLIDPITDISRYKHARHKYFSMLAAYLPGQMLANPAIYQPYLSYKQRQRQAFPELIGVLRQHGIGIEKIRQIEHHEAHAATAYYLSWHRNGDEPILTFTLDGSGDGLCGTVSIGEGMQLKRIKAIPSYHSPGIIYSRVTQYLGMKPLEHEYKVMGLAPYAPEKLTRPAYEVFRRYLSLSPDGLSFQNNSGAWGNSLLRRLADDCFQMRFDGIAAGLQQRFEELSVEFIQNWIKKTGIRNIAVAGGSFMNVKLNMLLMNLAEVDKLFIMPSCGDESIALGAALQVYADQYQAEHKQDNIAPLGDLYLGTAFTTEDIERALQPYQDQVRYRRIPDIEEETAHMLAQDKIVGRLSGRMEWGARALGNRSILANPSNPRIIPKINAAIKMRDFWMPFAASVLWERRHDYLISEKDVPAPYMVLAFQTTPLAQKDLIAGLHPFDLTCRPQLVEQERNPKYHALLKHFEALTGIGGVLNTSFNIHGYPILRTPEDAIETLLNSGLDAITLEEYLVERH